MNLFQCRKQRGGAEDISYRIKLDNENTFFDLLVMVTGAKYTRCLVPYAWPIPHEESTIKCDLTCRAVQQHKTSLVAGISC